MNASLGHRLTRPLRDLSRSLRGRRQARAMLEHERPVYRDFAAFYDSLANRERVFYTFFSTRLLHWVKKCLEFVPPDVNLVLIGSNLTPDELSWVRAHTDRPFHAIPQQVDDKTVWEMLMATNRHDFGWLDVDCLVKNPALFAEMAEVPRDASLNTAWALYDEDAEVEFPYMHMVFVNLEAARDPRMRATGVTPCTYSYEGGTEGRHAPHAYTRTLDARQRRLVDEILGPRDRRKNRYLNDRQYFDTLQLYGLVAQHLGWRLNKVRKHGGRRDREHNSADVIHVNGVSQVNRPDLDWGGLTEMLRRNFLAVLLADSLLLWEVSAELPPLYAEVAAGREQRIAAIAGEPFPRERMLALLHSHVQHCFADGSLETDERWSFMRPQRAAVPA